MNEHVLTGLDGTNPLAFLAALGTLRAAGGRARLHWRDEGRWRPVLTLPADAPDPVSAVMANLERWRAGALALELQYAKAEKGDESKRVRDLKPPPKEFREFLEHVRASWPADADSADFAVAYATEAGRDNKGNTKPTALHFTAGKQAFLDMVIELRDGLTREYVEEALHGPWLYASKLPVLRWDVSGERQYALVASDPQKAKPQGVPGADWLAFLGLSFLPTFPRGTRTLTTGFDDASKEPSFGWPLWTQPLGRDVVGSLLALDLRDMNVAERRARGIALVLSSKARRSDRGYGNFAAASPA